MGGGRLGVSAMVTALYGLMLSYNDMGGWYGGIVEIWEFRRQVLSARGLRLRGMGGGVDL